MTRRWRYGYSSTTATNSATPAGDRREPIISRSGLWCGGRQAVALQGDLDLAFRLGKEAVDLVGARKGFFTRTAVGALAQAHLHAGDPAGCVGLLLGDTDGRQLADADPVTRGAWYLALAQAEAAQGHPEEALRWAERAQLDAAVAFVPRLAASAQLARAYALLATDPVRAAAHARTAAESLADYGDRIGSGQAYLAAGTALAAIGDADSARDRFARARALFSDCGAHLLALQVRREENRLAGATTLMRHPVWRPAS